MEAGPSKRRHGGDDEGEMPKKLAKKLVYVSISDALSFGGLAGLNGNAGQAGRAIRCAVKIPNKCLFESDDIGEMVKHLSVHAAYHNSVYTKYNLLICLV